MQGPLQGPALLGQITAAVGGDAPGQRAVHLGEPFLGDERDELGAAPGAYEGDRPHALECQVGQEVGGLGCGGTAYGGPLLAVQLGQRRLPEGEDHLAPGRGVVGDLLDRQARETARGDRGLCRGGGGEEEDGVGPVAGAEAA